MDFYGPLHKSVNTERRGRKYEKSNDEKNSKSWLWWNELPEEFQSLKMISIEIVTTFGTKGRNRKETHKPMFQYVTTVSDEWTTHPERPWEPAEVEARVPDLRSP